MYELLRQCSWPEEEFKRRYNELGRHCFCRFEELKALEWLEGSMGVAIPSSLRTFYEEIGFGGFASPDEDSTGQRVFVVSPWALAELYLKMHESWRATPLENACRRLVDGEPDYPYHHLADEGEMPCIHLMERIYWVMRPLSDKPNAVYLQRGGDLLCEDFAELMKLLHEDPTYGWF